MGTFEGAIHPGTGSFREFPAWVESTLRPLVEQRKPKAIAMFCTGGIRCEKAAIVMRSAGLQHVYQLDGGILQYFERTEGAPHWRGRCVVFDERGSLDAALRA